MPKDAAGNVLAGRTVTWTTDAAAVATVSTTGLVTAASLGTATITATSETKTATALVTVRPGALIGAAGGTVTSADGNATVVIPAGALSQPTGITVAPATTFPASALLVTGTPYDFGPTGTQFAQPVSVRIKYDPAKVPAGTPQAAIQLNVAGAAGWTLLDGGSVDTVAHVVQGPTTHFSTISAVDAPFILTEPDPDGLITSLSEIVTDVTVCLGAGAELAAVSLAPFGTLDPASFTVSSDHSSIASVEKSPDFLSQGGPPRISIEGEALGTAQITVVLARASGPFTVHVNVTVINTTPPCKKVPLVASRSETTGDLIDLVLGALAQSITTDPTATLGAVGPFGTQPPFGFRLGSNQNSWRLVSAFGGPNTAETPVPAIANNTPVGTAFYDANTFMFLELSTNNGAVDIYATTRASGVPIRLTNLRGNMNGVGAAPDGKLFLDWRPTAGGTSHIFSLPFPGLSGPPVTSGLVPVTSGTGEIEPAVSQNNAWVAYVQFDAAFSHTQIMALDVSKPANPPVPISPPAGYAFSPQWCGVYVYFTYAAGLNGPFHLMRRHATLTPSEVVTAELASNVQSLSIARVGGALRNLVCPH